MQQRNKSDYTEAISMEEYLTKRQKIREKEQKRGSKRTETERERWMLMEHFV